MPKSKPEPGRVVRDLDGWGEYRDGDDEYRERVDELKAWLNSLDYGTRIVYDGIEYHKPEYRFNFWYEKGWDIGCPVEHTVFAEWFARAAGGDRTKIEVK